MGAELIIAIVALGVAAISSGTSIFTIAYYRNKFSAISEDRKTVDVETITTEEQFMPRAKTNVTLGQDHHPQDGPVKVHTTRHTPQLTTRITKKQVVRIEETDLDKITQTTEGMRNGLPNKTAETLASGAGAVGTLLKPNIGIAGILSSAATKVGEVVEARRKSISPEKPPAIQTQQNDSSDTHEAPEPRSIKSKEASKTKPRSKTEEDFSTLHVTEAEPYTVKRDKESLTTKKPLARTMSDITSTEGYIYGDDYDTMPRISSIELTEQPTLSRISSDGLPAEPSYMTLPDTNGSGDSEPPTPYSSPAQTISARSNKDILFISTKLQEAATKGQDASKNFQTDSPQTHSSIFDVFSTHTIPVKKVTTTETTEEITIIGDSPASSIIVDESGTT